MAYANSAQLRCHRHPGQESKAAAWKAAAWLRVLPALLFRVPPIRARERDDEPADGPTSEPREPKRRARGRPRGDEQAERSDDDEAGADPT
eukprot:8606110-Lingulodinium_polyedra.AAC.1